MLTQPPKLPPVMPISGQKDQIRLDKARATATLIKLRESLQVRAETTRLLKSVWSDT